MVEAGRQAGWGGLNQERPVAGRKRKWQLLVVCSDRLCLVFVVCIVGKLGRCPEKGSSVVNRGEGGR